MLRALDIETDTTTWPRGTPAPRALTQLTGTRAVDVSQALLSVGLRTRPPHLIGLQLSDYWAWLRYFPAVDQTRDLRLRREWRDLDPHQKTILSDDWGMGFATYILGDALGVAIWADTRHVVDLLAPAVRLTSTNKMGPRKSPDFLGLDWSWKFVVLECKGTQSSREGVAAQLVNTGQDQKSDATIDFAPGIDVRGRLAAGLFVPAGNMPEDALLLIHDPPGKRESPTMSATPEQLARAVCRSELASLLPLAGMPDAGRDLTDPERTELSDNARTALRGATSDGDGFSGITREFRFPRGQVVTRGESPSRALVSFEVARPTMAALIKPGTIEAAVDEITASALARQERLVTLELDKAGARWQPTATPVEAVRKTATGVRVTVRWQA